MTDEEFYAAQVGRLSGLRFPKTDPLAIGELVKALWTHSASREHAERIVTRALETGFGPRSDEAPTTADIVRLAEDTPAEAPEPMKEPDGSCRRCRGRGVVHFQRPGPGIWRDTLYDYTAPCPCRKGAAV